MLIQIDVCGGSDIVSTLKVLIMYESYKLQPRLDMSRTVITVSTADVSPGRVEDRSAKHGMRSATGSRALFLTGTVV